MLVTLMHQDNEVLEFDIDLTNQAVLHIRPLDAPELALPGTLDGTQEANERLGRFLRSRSLAPQRPDLDSILEATGTASAIELAVRAGGFSLSDQYWYRTQPGALTWRGSNFFCNAWDTTFGEAVLARNHTALAKADVATPDATCGGVQRKAWVFLDGKPHLLKASNDESTAVLVGEVLASHLLKLLLPPEDHVPYELVVHNGTACSSSPLFVNESTDLLSASTVGDFEPRLSSDGTWIRPKWENFERALDDIGVDNGRLYLPKLAVASSLCLYGDMHGGNLGVMRNHVTGALSLPPLFDLGGAFGTFNRGFARSAKANRELAELFVTWGFRSLDPAWDYSWCNLAPLEGFGETIEGMLGQCEELVASDYPTFARKLFESQLAYVASVITG